VTVHIDKNEAKRAFADECPFSLPEDEKNSTLK